MHVLISALHRASKPTGVCRYAANLAECLADTPEITKVTLIVGAWQREYFSTAFNLCFNKINIVSVDIKNSSLSRNSWFLLGLPQLAHRLRPDLVHLSFPLPFARSLFPCPVISTVHDLYPYELPENFGKLHAGFNRLFLKQCVVQSDALTCVSQTTLDRLRFFFPDLSAEQESTVIYNVVDFKEVQMEVPEFFRGQESTPFLLSVAQHRKNKNLNLLIYSYGFLLRMKKIDTATKLILVGSQGPETENLIRQIEELKLQDNVHLLSSINDGELSWLYQQCQSFIMPSSIEGFCLPLAEAMHLSCKVVCSDIPIFREIGSAECVYFSLQDNPIGNLAQAISQVIQQPSVVSKSARFSKLNISNQYLQFYSSIVQNVNRGQFELGVPNYQEPAKTI
jgi:glycosyltransferase involved in cell wall biosynthesis